MLPIRSKIQYLQTERKILQSVCNTKLKGDRTSLLKTLNSYTETSSDPHFYQKYEAITTMIGKAPKIFFNYAMKHILNLTIKIQMGREETRRAECAMLFFVKNYDEIMPKLQVVSFVEVRNPEPRQEITTEDIKGWLEDFKANSSKENIRDIVKKIKGFKTMLFILFDGHPFIFPRIEGDKIQNLRWNEFEVDTAALCQTAPGNCHFLSNCANF